MYRSFRLYSVVVLIACCPWLRCTTTGEPIETVTQWSMYEIQLKTREQYTQPFLRQEDPLVTVDFRHVGSGQSLTLEGFWDGGENWRVRFAPPLAGVWTWQSISTDAGMNDQTGQLRALPPSKEQIAENPNFRGHLRIAQSGRYFMYDDGTPFFWLGDTIWKINSPACQPEGSLHTWLRDRLGKGFTVANVQYMRKLFQSNEGGHPFPDNTDDNGNFENLNPAFFQALDRRLDIIWRNGLVIAGPPGWWGKRNDGPSNITPQDAMRISRYLLARYGAYNMVWALSGEYQYSYDQMKQPWTTDNWNRLGALVQQVNTYRHPVSIHPSGRQGERAAPSWPAHADEGSSGGEFHDAAWLDHNWLQTGQNRESLPYVPLRVLQYYRRTPIKPVVHSEGWYEGAPGDERNAGPVEIRWQAWGSLLSGAAGHVYGAKGIWPFYDPEDPDQSDERGNTAPWWEALQFEGSGYMRFVRDFFKTIPWWTLQPHDEWLTAGNASPDHTEFSAPFCAAVPDSMIVLYFPGGNRAHQYTLQHIKSGVYTAQWYNPRNGAWTPITIKSLLHSEANDVWTIPPMPDDQDWVILLKRSN